MPGRDKVWNHWRRWEDSDRGMRDQSFERIGRQYPERRFERGGNYIYDDQPDNFASSDYNRNLSFDPNHPGRRDERRQSRRREGHTDYRQMDHGDYQYEGMIQHPRGWTGSFRQFQNEDEGLHYGKGPKNYRRSDDRIYEEVCESLTADPDVDASDIDIGVENGVVTLRGTVATRKMKRWAEECVEDLPGVEDVRNALTLKNVEYGGRLGDFKDESLRSDQLQ